MLATLISPGPTDVIAAAGRVDIVHDEKRDLLYISTTGGDVLRYDLDTETFLAPFEYPGRLMSLDLSPDEDKLVIADPAMDGVHVVDLTTAANQDYFFSTSSSGSGGSYSAVFKDDQTVLVSAGSSLRQLNLTTGAVSIVRAGGMLAASPDRSVIGFAETGGSNGLWGRIRLSDGNIATANTGWFGFEIGVNLNGSQYAVPTYGGTYVYNANLQQMAIIGTYAREFPIGVTYSPDGDTVYFAWGGHETTNHTRLEAYDTTTLRRVQTLDAGANFPSNGNAAFTNGRLKTSRDGSMLFSTVPGGVNIYRVSEPPVLSALAGGAYAENDPPLTFGDANLVDDDSANFAEGKVRVGVTANAHPQDVLSVRSQGSEAGQISVTGNNVFYGGVAIGTFAGGQGAVPLTIQLNSNATVEAVRALVRNITFHNTSADPGNATRTVTFQVSDGDGGISQPVDVTVQVTSVNTAPVVQLGGTHSFREGPAAILLAVAANLSDDGADLAGGSLHVAISDAASADDRLLIVPRGTGATAITVFSDRVYYGSSQVGVFSGGTGAAPLVVQFNTPAATVTAAREVLRSIGFRNVSDTPDTAQRTITYVVDDGDGMQSTPRMKLVDVVPVNDRPVMTLDAGLGTYIEDSAAIAISPSALLHDPDSPSFAGGSLIVSFATGGDANDQLEILHQGSGEGQIGVSGTEVSYGGAPIGTFQGGDSGNPLSISFTTGADPASVQALLRAVAFRTEGDAPSTSPRAIRFAISDDAGGRHTRARWLRVSAVDDGISLAGGGTVGYEIGGAGIRIMPTATATDPDTQHVAGALLSIHSQGADRDDRIRVGGPFTYDGQNIVLGGTVIATRNALGGIGSTDLEIRFNADANVAIVQLLLRSITFRTASSPGQRVLALDLTDGNGKVSDPLQCVVNVRASTAS